MSGPMELEPGAPEQDTLALRLADVRALARTAGFRGRIEEDGGGSARSGAVSWQCSDIAAAGDSLGRRPSYVLDESLAALWAATSLRSEGGRTP